MASLAILMSISERCLLQLRKTGRRLGHTQSRDFPLPSIAKENRIKIGNQNIRYVTVGHGPHKVVCIPAALGTIWTDFRPQIEGFDREKFTLTTFDLPGFGKNTPPQKTYCLDFHETDADLIHDLLKTLGLSKYSILGWCYGGVVAMIYAAKHPDEVAKLVVWGAGSHVLPEELKTFQGLSDINTWSPSTLQPRVDFYGEQLLAQHWQDLINIISRRYIEKKGDYCTGMLKYIKCPTYILHGGQDTLLHNAHFTYLKNHIKKSRTHIYPEGNHNIHLRYADDFNRRVQDFLLERDGTNDNNN